MIITPIFYLLRVFLSSLQSKGEGKTEVQVKHKEDAIMMDYDLDDQPAKISYNPSEIFALGAPMDKDDFTITKSVTAYGDSLAWGGSKVSCDLLVIDGCTCTYSYSLSLLRRLKTR